MQNNPTLSSPQKVRLKFLKKRYFRTDKPWTQYQLVERGTPSDLQQYDIKVKKFLDEHGKDPKRGVSLEEILIGIECPKPWDKRENEIYNFLIVKLSNWYNRKYLRVLPEQLETGNPVEYEPRRGLSRPKESVTWRLRL